MEERPYGASKFAKFRIFEVCWLEIYGPIYVKFFTAQVLLQAQVQVLMHSNSKSKSKYLTLKSKHKSKY